MAAAYSDEDSGGSLCSEYEDLDERYWEADLRHVSVQCGPLCTMEMGQVAARWDPVAATWMSRLRHLQGAMCREALAAVLLAHADHKWTRPLWRWLSMRALLGGLVRLILALEVVDVDRYARRHRVVYPGAEVHEWLVDLRNALRRVSGVDDARDAVLSVRPRRGASFAARRAICLRPSMQMLVGSGLHPRRMLMVRSWHGLKRGSMTGRKRA